MIILKIERRIGKDEFWETFNKWLIDEPRTYIEPVKRTYNTSTRRSKLTDEERKENAKITQRKYYEKNRIEINEKRKSSYQKRPLKTEEEKKETARKYQEKNKEKMKLYQLEYRRKKGIKPKEKLTDEEKLTKQKESKKRYYQKNREKILKKIKNDRKDDKKV